MNREILEILNDERLSLAASMDRDQAALLLEKFLKELVRWNAKINLTAEKDAHSILNKHVYDSLQYARAISHGSKVMDIGSGGGFPGIPLKIIFPELFLVLVESQRKRAGFLSNVTRILQLENVQVLNERAENLGTDYLERFDTILFRSVTEVTQCLKLGGRFLTPGGRIIIKKEPDARPVPAVEQNDFSIRFIEEIPLAGGSGAESKLMIFEKCST